MRASVKLLFTLQTHMQELPSSLQWSVNRSHVYITDPAKKKGLQVHFGVLYEIITPTHTSRMTTSILSFVNN